MLPKRLPSVHHLRDLRVVELPGRPLVLGRRVSLVTGLVKAAERHIARLALIKVAPKSSGA